MQELRQHTKPIARQQGLIIEKTDDEVLIYDLERKMAHCLNPVASQVWFHCDGQTAISQLTQLVRDSTDATINEDLVTLALSELNTAHLLQSHEVEVLLSRRSMMRVAGIAAATALVTTIFAPSAVDAASGSGGGAAAATSAQCQSGLMKADGTCL